LSFPENIAAIAEGAIAGLRAAPGITMNKLRRLCKLKKRSTVRPWLAVSPPAHLLAWTGQNSLEWRQCPVLSTHRRPGHCIAMQSPSNPHAIPTQVLGVPDVLGDIEEELLATAANTLAERRTQVLEALQTAATQLAALLGHALRPELKAFLESQGLWPTLADRIARELRR